MGERRSSKATSEKVAATRLYEREKLILPPYILLRCVAPASILQILPGGAFFPEELLPIGGFVPPSFMPPFALKRSRSDLVTKAPDLFGDLWPDPSFALLQHVHES